MTPGDGWWLPTLRCRPRSPERPLPGIHEFAAHNRFKADDAFVRVLLNRDRAHIGHFHRRAVAQRRSVSHGHHSLMVGLTCSRP
jgi:hypothetical protein